MIRCFILSVALLGLAIDAAIAQQACARHGRAVCAPEGAVSLLKVEGDVRRSRGVGFKPVSPGDDLAPGDRLIVRKGSAVIDMASQCQLNVLPNSLITFTKADNAFCAHGLFSDNLGGQSSGAPIDIVPRKSSEAQKSTAPNR